MGKHVTLIHGKKIQSFHEWSVSFDDGSTKEFDAIIFADPGTSRDFFFCLLSTPTQDSSYRPRVPLTTVW